MIIHKYIILALATLGFEYAYTAWMSAIVNKPPTRVAVWAVAVSALGLVGVGGALTLRGGWVVYLISVGIGGYVSARLAR